MLAFGWNATVKETRCVVSFVLFREFDLKDLVNISELTHVVIPRKVNFYGRAQVKLRLLG
jgi:hypothetical protein